MPENPSSANIGLNLNSSPSQIKQGELSFAQNAQIESFDGNSVNYSNENGNQLCTEFPSGYRVIGKKNIIQKNFVVYFLVNPDTNQSEIGKVEDCKYSTVINASCLNFSIYRPIHKIAYKITSCTLELYWPDDNGRRWIDLLNLPYKESTGENCITTYTNEVDCNKLLVNPAFSIPTIDYVEEGSDGDLVAGSYQFAIQYANALGDEYTGYYGVTNPISINDPHKVTQDFNYSTDKSIKIQINNLDTTGIFDYINIAVIKTINGITTPELVDTRKINDSSITLIYTGVSKTEVQLSMSDILEQFPTYAKADGVEDVQDVLIWYGITTSERINYQKIASQIKLQWQTWRFPKEDGYNKAINTGKYKGYMRDEVYPFEFVPILSNGEIEDGFFISPPKATPYQLELIDNNDSQIGDNHCAKPEPQPRWKIYNTGESVGYEVEVCNDESTHSSGNNATLYYSCSDAKCTHQGNVTLQFVFDNPTTAPITLLVGQVNQYTTGLFASGFDLFTLPSGTQPDTYWGEHNHLPFEIHIPAGIKEYTTQGPIYLQGNTSPETPWVCQSCLWELKELYLKPSVPISFNNSQGFNIHNLNTKVEDPIENPKGSKDCIDDCYTGPYQFGNFGYYESTDTYPCDEETWGEDAGQPIRYHRFPDSSITHIHDNEGYIYPIGVKINVDQIKELIRNSSLTQEQKDRIVGFKIIRGDRSNNKSIVAKGLLYNVGEYTRDETTHYFPNYPYNDLRKDPFLNTSPTEDDSRGNEGTALDAFKESSKSRYTFHSPDTSFYHPSLGNILKLETVEFGKSRGHFVEVKDHARYKFVTSSSYVVAIAIGVAITLIPQMEMGGVVVGIQFPGMGAAFQAFKTTLDIIDRLIPRKNFAYQYNSVGEYNKFKPVTTIGNKLREIIIGYDMIPGYQAVGDNHTVNNFQRESSIYLKTNKPLPFPHENSGVPEDNSRFNLRAVNCNTPTKVIERDISSYYGSIKKSLANQYGTMYSYQTVDTGFYQAINLNDLSPSGTRTIWGGDTFINRFALKKKFPFFIDNRVKAPDDSDVAYNEIPNVAYANYWFSTDVRAKGTGGLLPSIKELLGVRVNNFDCPGDKFFYQLGKMYLFSYGIPYFYVESQVNVDYRQAFNDKEGEFYPHVSTDIPDEWLHEVHTTIQQDNTYVYNKSYSKQNKEIIFSHLPEDYKQECYKEFPNKAIYSDQHSEEFDYKKNNWLIYRPISFYDFPLSNGKLISLESMENRAILARFENHSKLYNAMLTINTSNPQAAYIGNDSLFRGAPPIDFAETELGYNGTQHTFFLKTENGHVSIDCKRGQIFLISGSKALDITSREFKVDTFFKENLPFQISKYFKDIDIDNHYLGIGLHGTYDSKYNRIIITKLDYKPNRAGITYKDNKFYFNDKKVLLTDYLYFDNKSFTISFDIDNRTWVSFHSYLPNFYVGGINTFYSGINSPQTSTWEHNINSLFNMYYGTINPYVLEYPIQFKNSEILQSIQDETKVRKGNVMVDNYFNKVLIYNDQQCSGIRNLIHKQLGNPRAYLAYPKYNTDNIDILYTKDKHLYNYNMFWDIVKDSNQPIYTQKYPNLVLNFTNLDYSNKIFRKFPLRSRDTFIRHILDNDSSLHFISQFIVAQTETDL